MEVTATTYELHESDPTEMGWMRTAETAQIALAPYMALMPLPARIQHQLALRSIQAAILYNERREDPGHAYLAAERRKQIAGATA